MRRSRVSAVATKQEQFNAISQHINKRFGELASLMAEGKKVVIASRAPRSDKKEGRVIKNPTDRVKGPFYEGALGHQLGVGLAKDQWGDDTLWLKIVRLIDERVVELQEVFPQEVFPDRLSFGEVPDLEERKKRENTIFVWGANCDNWNKPKESGVGGGGQAGAIGGRDTTSFGIVTTPHLYNKEQLKAEDVYLLEEGAEEGAEERVERRRRPIRIRPSAAAPAPTAHFTAEQIAQNIIQEQNRFLTSAAGQKIFYTTPLKPLGLLKHTVGFDWWIFPGFTDNTSKERYKISPKNRGKIYGILFENETFRQNYEHCLKKYLTCAKENPEFRPDTARIQKVFESMHGFDFKVNPKIRALAEGVYRIHKETIESSPHRDVYARYFKDLLAPKEEEPPPHDYVEPTSIPGKGQPAAGPPLRTARTRRRASSAPAAPPPPIGVGAEKFVPRKPHENALLRFLVRKFNNNGTYQCNIGAAKFLEGSALYLIAQEKHEEARKKLLDYFNYEIGEMQKPGYSSYFREFSNGIPPAERDETAKQFLAGLALWHNALNQPNALEDYAAAFQNSQNNAQISTTEGFDKTQLDPILQAKAKIGDAVPYPEQIFEFQLSTTSCQIATPQGKPLFNARGTLGSEFSLNSFCYPRFDSIKNKADSEAIEKKVTAQFTLALQNLQADIKPPKTEGLFMVVPPGAFVRGMLVPGKNLIARIIVKSLQTAIKTINDPRIKIQFSGSQAKNNDHDDFGWGFVKSDIDAMGASFTNSELLSQAQYCEANNIAFQVPMMGEPLGAIGNGASGSRANSATDEYLARATGGMHCVTLNASENQVLENKAAIISKRKPASLPFSKPPRTALPPESGGRKPPPPRPSSGRRKTRSAADPAPAAAADQPPPSRRRLLRRRSIGVDGAPAKIEPAAAAAADPLPRMTTSQALTNYGTTNPRRAEALRKWKEGLKGHTGQDKQNALERGETVTVSAEFQKFGYDMYLQSLDKEKESFYDNETFYRRPTQKELTNEWRGHKKAGNIEKFYGKKSVAELDEELLPQLFTDVHITKRGPKDEDREIVSHKKPRVTFTPEIIFEPPKKDVDDNKVVVHVNFANFYNFGGDAMTGPAAQEEDGTLSSPAMTSIAFAQQGYNREHFLNLENKGKAIIYQNIPMIGSNGTISKTDQLAIAAHCSRDDAEHNTLQKARDHLSTALTGFTLCKEKNPTKDVVVRSGLWGSGAFGNSRYLMMAVQVLAAQQADVKLELCNAYDTQHVIEFQQKLFPIIEKISVDTSLTVDEKLEAAYTLCHEKQEELLKEDVDPQNGGPRVPMVYRSERISTKATHAFAFNRAMFYATAAPPLRPAAAAQPTAPAKAAPPAAPAAASRAVPTPERPRPPSPSPAPASAKTAITSQLQAQITAYTDKKYNRVNPQVKTMLDASIKSQETVPNPDQVYRGCGIKVDPLRNESGQVTGLAIREIFAKDIPRFFTPGEEGGLFAEEKCDELLTNQIITKIRDGEGNYQPISKMSQEDILRAFHNPNRIDFEIASPNPEETKTLEVSCKSKELFVTKTCTQANVRGAQYGAKYDVTTHGVVAIDPKGKILTQFPALASPAMTGTTRS